MSSHIDVVHCQLLKFRSLSKFEVILEVFHDDVSLARCFRLTRSTSNLDGMPHHAPIATWFNTGDWIQIQIDRALLQHIDDISFHDVISFSNVTPLVLRRRGKSVSAACASLGLPDPGLTSAPTAEFLADLNHVSQKEAPPPCRNWEKTGQCDRKNCQFRHEGRDPVPSIEENQDGSDHDHSLNPRSHDVSDSHVRRAHIFAEFLVSTFGVERLRAGTGVVDVAGGKGRLSFILTTEFGIPSTVIDPRPPESVNLTRKQKKLLRHNPDTMRHAFIHEQLDLESLTRNADLMHLVQNCSLICGLHPDQATDCIVQYAIRFSKPFACVPCCVFSSVFTHRQVTTSSTTGQVSRPVLTRSDLCIYLKNMCKHAHIETLPLSGANAVVFRTESCAAAADSFDCACKYQ